MISIDFFIELPEFIEFDVVMTIVDLISKTTYFVLIYITVSTEGVVRLFLHHV